MHIQFLSNRYKNLFILFPFFVYLISVKAQTVFIYEPNSYWNRTDNPHVSKIILTTIEKVDTTTNAKCKLYYRETFEYNETGYLTINTNYCDDPIPGCDSVQPFRYKSEYKYNANKDCVEQLGYENGDTSMPTSHREWTYTYDQENRILKETSMQFSHLSPKGYTKTFLNTYNKKGNLVKRETYMDGIWTSTVRNMYNAKDSIIMEEHSEAGGIEQTFSYIRDIDGRCVKKTFTYVQMGKTLSPSPSSEELSYNACGQNIMQITHHLPFTIKTFYEYTDSCKQLLTETIYQKNNENSSPYIWQSTRTYEYNDRGLISKVTDLTNEETMYITTLRYEFR
jgi:hypothetical protein